MTELLERIAAALERQVDISAEQVRLYAEGQRASSQAYAARQKVEEADAAEARAYNKATLDEMKRAVSRIEGFKRELDAMKRHVGWTADADTAHPH